MGRERERERYVTFVVEANACCRDSFIHSGKRNATCYTRNGVMFLGLALMDKIPLCETGIVFPDCTNACFCPSSKQNLYWIAGLYSMQTEIMV